METRYFQKVVSEEKEKESLLVLPKPVMNEVQMEEVMKSVGTKAASA
jgi:hypothetical protein